ncbi:MAG: hypothetical protein Q8P59_12615, partial [Dehalococcoidia bacterium]|nr:hypothetical protein [Dehalococcoidia bacterium]
IIPIALYWEAIAPTSQRYKVFVHLLGPDATLWGQHDSEPAGGSSSTTDWRPGEAVADNHGLPIALGTPPGESGQYEIEVGMYDPATGQRLPVFDSNGNPIGDRVVLGTVQVVKPAAFPSRESLAIEHPLDVHYRELLLMGYEFFKLGTATGNVDFRTGDLAHLALFWRAEAKPADYFPPSAVILDSANQEVARYNGTAAGKYGTSRWDPGEVVRDQYKLALSIPPGSYRLALIVTHAGGPLPVNPTGQGLKLIDGKLILAEFQVK